MSPPLERPIVRYGMGFSSAAVLTFVAVTFLDGTTQLLVLGLAVLEILVVPQILKRAQTA
ncbi:MULTISPECIES: hypothetical protein [Halobellus]|uniref:hypothetical protein n=1 Tax=Halobellus TaxID=1073986 RepID=UPI0021093FC8|nr:MULTISPECIES: hypothetical protein [Halobellus]MDQ2053528.1 hypothetical protein [Halobellus sp. H-GB7]